MKKLAMLQQKHLYLGPYICLDNILNSSVHEKLLILGKSWANFFTQYTNIDKVEIFHVLQPSLSIRKSLQVLQMARIKIVARAFYIFFL